MNQEERSYKIGKIVKYSDELADVEKNISKSTVAFGLCAIAAALNFSLLSRDALSFELETLFGLGGPLYTGFAVSKLKELLESINRKTVLQIKIEDIQDDVNFEIFKEEESRKKL